MSTVLEGNILTVTFEDDNWKTEQPSVITSVVDSSSGFYSANTFTHDGKNVLRSGAIGHKGTSQTVINFTLMDDGNIELNYKVSSENGCDWFYILIDGTEVVKKAGTVDFTVYTQNLSAGEHSITLKYSKNYSTSVGSDCGAIGYLKFTGVLPPLLKKYLVVIGETVYSWNGTELTETSLSYSSLIADDFENSGFDEITTELCNILKSHVTFKILHWQEDIDKAVPLYTAKISGTPEVDPTLIFDVDFSDVLTGIESVQAIFDGSPLMAFSVDNGATWWGYAESWTESDMYVSNCHLLTESVMTEFLGENKQFKVRITLTAESEFTSLKFVYREE